LEGYDDSYEFRIFEGKDATYSKYRAFLIPNNFVHIRLTVQEGWVNKEGKKSDPRIQFINVQYLQDVMANYAKNLVIRFRLEELEDKNVELILNAFRKNRGNHTVTFEVYEFDKTQPKIEVASPVVLKPQIEDSELEEIVDFMEADPTEIAQEELIVVPEEEKPINVLAMNSRTVKINICKDLLDELEKNQIYFTLN
jgi:DNA polymerase-3 subunit alpha